MIRKAGFHDVRSYIHIKYKEYNLAIRKMSGYGLRGHPMYDSGRLFRRKVFYRFVNKLSNNRLIGPVFMYLMNKMSMLTVTFTAGK
jgi:hypothetical protein